VQVDDGVAVVVVVAMVAAVVDEIMDQYSDSFESYPSLLMNELHVVVVVVVPTDAVVVLAAVVRAIIVTASLVVLRMLLWVVTAVRRVTKLVSVVANLIFPSDVDASDVPVVDIICVHHTLQTLFHS